MRRPALEEKVRRGDHIGDIEPGVVVPVLERDVAGTRIRLAAVAWQFGRRALEEVVGDANDVGDVEPAILVAVAGKRSAALDKLE